MSILDGKLEFMDATSIAADNAVTVEGDVLDLGVAYDAWGQSITPNVGSGNGLYLNCRIATTLAITTTLNPDTEAYTPVRDAPTWFLCTHSSATGAYWAGETLMRGRIGYTNATSVAGSDVFRGKIPAGEIKRYLSFIVLAGSSTIVTGALDAWLSLDTESLLPIN
jgi:hypothetical protein